MNEGADRIIRRILDDARREAEAVTAEAAQKAGAIIDEARENAAGLRDRLLAQARKEAAEQKRRILSVAQLDARKEMLAAKQEMIAEVFRQALEKLAGLDDQTYFALLRDMLLAMAVEGEAAVILSSRDRARLPANFWDEINSALARAGKKARLTPAQETREMRGGFILQSGGFEINCSFEALLAARREELEPVVAGVLFRSPDASPPERSN